MSGEKCRCGHTEGQHDWAYDQCCSGSGPTKYGCGCGGFTTEPTPTIEEVRARPTADVTREPTGGQGLREAVVAALREDNVWWADDTDGPADAVLALPELAALIADAERVREMEATVARVRTLATTIRETPGMGPLAGALFQILDGDQ